MKKKLFENIGGNQFKINCGLSEQRPIQHDLTTDPTPSEEDNLEKLMDELEYFDNAVHNMHQYSVELSNLHPEQAQAIRKKLLILISNMTDMVEKEIKELQQLHSANPSE